MPLQTEESKILSGLNFYNSRCLSVVMQGFPPGAATLTRKNQRGYASGASLSSRDQSRIGVVPYHAGLNDTAEKTRRKKSAKPLSCDNYQMISWGALMVLPSSSEGVVVGAKVKTQLPERSLLHHSCFNLRSQRNRVVRQL